MTNPDPSNMYRMIADYPLQFAKGFDLALKTKIDQPVENIIISSMGGSALSGDLISCAFEEKLKQQVAINRNYLTTQKLNERTLVIAISFSGNTEETLSTYKQAVDGGAQVVVVAAGGKLLELAAKDGKEFVKLIKESPDFQPRMSTGYIFAILTSLLVKAGWLPFSVEAEVRDMAAKLSALNTEVQGKQLGESLFRTIPLIYASDMYWPVARIAKIKLNENSKIPAFWNILPELNHNEMVGFSNTSDNYRIVILRDPGGNPKISQRMMATADILRQRPIGLKTTIWDMLGGTKLEKMFSTLMVWDFASYYLALKMGINPTPVKLVEDFKSLIK